MKNALAAALILLSFLSAGPASSACRDLDVARAIFRPLYAAQPDATVEFFGHNFFQIISSKGTRIITDPVAPGFYRTPKVTPHAVTIGREQPIEARATYVFDKGYCDYAWWTRIHQAKARFVTRPKSNVRFRLVRRRELGKHTGDGFILIDDANVSLATQGKSKLAIPLRRIRLRRQDGRIMTIITNDRRRSPVAIAALYKARWQIELLFRWIKQHLKMRKFIGRSQNAIRLQILAAMIAFLLLRIAARLSRSGLAAIRLVQLVAACLFVRKPIHRIDKPPENNPSKPTQGHSPNQMEFCYA